MTTPSATSASRSTNGRRARTEPIIAPPPRRRSTGDGRGPAGEVPTASVGSRPQELAARTRPGRRRPRSRGRRPGTRAGRSPFRRWDSGSRHTPNGLAGRRSTLARGHRDGAEAGAEDAAQGPEDVVPGAMAEAVAHELEVVEVGEHERERAVEPLGALELEREHLHEPAAVREAGQLVRHRLRLHEPV